MAKVTLCDCCGEKETVGPAVMTLEGIHRPKPVRRQDGHRPEYKSIDLCQECCTAFATQWDRIKRRHNP